jgi:3-oxoacyl-[acyl-carrier protein] reductase
MDLGVRGRRAAVAAGSAGLGLGSAVALAENGAQVVICGRDEGRLRAAVAQIGHGCRYVVCDVADAAGGERFVHLAGEVLGGVDILVCNSGGPKPGNFESIPVDAYQSALDQSLMSVVGMCKAAIPAMQERSWGRVVAITSVGVRQPLPNIILSNTARTGLTGFLKTVAREVAKDGVTVNSVQPGLHLTDRVRSVYADAEPDAVAMGIPSGTLGDPMDFGQVVAFLCSEQARYVTGAHLPIDGGMVAGLQ